MLVKPETPWTWRGDFIYFLFLLRIISRIRNTVQQTYSKPSGEFILSSDVGAHLKGLEPSERLPLVIVHVGDSV